MFDPYRKWLGIPRWEQPPDHYRLLGITLFENDPDVVEAAADRQMAHIRNYQAGQHSEISQKILNELSNARVCLLNREQKKAYDDQLRTELAKKAGQVQLAGPPFGFFVKGAARYFLLQAQRGWIVQSVLPPAYLALGRDVHAAGRFRDRAEDLYRKLGNVAEGLASSRPAPPSADEQADGPSRDVGFFGRIKNSFRAAFYTQRQKTLLRAIGQTAFTAAGPDCGPPGLSEPVRQGLARLEELRHEIELLGEIPPNTWLSPKRLAWIVLAIVAVLFLLVVWARAMW